MNRLGIDRWPQFGVTALAHLCCLFGSGCTAKYPTIHVKRIRDFTRSEAALLGARIHTIKVVAYRSLRTGRYHRSAVRAIHNHLRKQGYRVVMVGVGLRAGYVHADRRGNTMLKPTAPLRPGEALLEVYAIKYKGTARITEKTTKKVATIRETGWGSPVATVHKHSTEVRSVGYIYCHVAARLFFKKGAGPAYSRRVTAEPGSFHDLVPAALAGIPKRKKQQPK